MTEPQRWIATVDSKGDLQEVRHHSGPESNGPRETTNGTYEFIAETKQGASYGAMWEWMLVARHTELFTGYDDPKNLNVIRARIDNMTHSLHVERVYQYESSRDRPRREVWKACHKKFADLDFQGEIARELVQRLEPKWATKLWPGQQPATSEDKYGSDQEG